MECLFLFPSQSQFLVAVATACPGDASKVELLGVGWTLSRNLQGEVGGGQKQLCDVASLFLIPPHPFNRHFIEVHDTCFPDPDVALSFSKGKMNENSSFWQFELPPRF